MQINVIPLQPIINSKLTGFGMEFMVAERDRLRIALFLLFPILLYFINKYISYNKFLKESVFYCCKPVFFYLTLLAFIAAYRFTPLPKFFINA
jgi:hypothetical protein